jgi:formyl-CoA transferase/CoA:oxalate CoA-transferase
MLEGQLSLLQGTIRAYMADGVLPEPMGTAYKALLPYQTFRTKTKDLALAVGSDKLWRSFAPSSVLKRCWTTRAMPQTPPRVQNRATLIAKLRTFLTDLRGVKLSCWRRARWVHQYD